MLPAKKQLFAVYSGHYAAGGLAVVGGEAATTGGAGGGVDAVAGRVEVERVFAEDAGRPGLGGVGDEDHLVGGER